MNTRKYVIFVMFSFETNPYKMDTAVNLPKIHIVPFTCKNVPLSYTTGMVLSPNKNLTHLAVALPSSHMAEDGTSSVRKTKQIKRRYIGTTSN